MPAEEWGSPKRLREMEEKVIKEYPGVRDLVQEGFYLRKRESSDGTLLEFRAPGYDNNTSSKYLVEVRHRSAMNPDDIVGDLLHAIPDKPKSELALLRRMLIKEIPEEDLIFTYESSKEEYGEERSFQEWADKTGYAAYFRGSVVNQCPSYPYSKKQKMIKRRVLEILKGEPSTVN